MLDVAAAPQLIEKPQDVQKAIEDSLVWECKATGKPKPSFRWMKNGENLEPTEVSSDFRDSAFAKQKIRGVLKFIIGINIITGL